GAEIAMRDHRVDAAAADGQDADDGAAANAHALVALVGEAVKPALMLDLLEELQAAGDLEVDIAQAAHEGGDDYREDAIADARLEVGQAAAEPGGEPQDEEGIDGHEEDAGPYPGLRVLLQADISRVTQSADHQQLNQDQERVGQEHVLQHVGIV